MPIQSNAKVVIAEDDSVLSFMMDELCRSAGYDVVGCGATAAETIALVDRHEPDIVILDFNLKGDRNGLEVITEIKVRHPRVKTLLVTGWDINDIASRMNVDQPDRILRKPVLPNTLLSVMEQALSVDAPQ